MQQLTFYLSAFFVIAGIASALIIALDLRMRHQTMPIMQPVWILTGLWANILGLVAYFWFGRAAQQKQMKAMPEMKMEGMQGMKMDGMEGMARRPVWQSVVVSTLHCGAGCTLADLVGEWVLWYFPIVLGGSLVAGSWAVDYVLALTFGIGFQYAAIRGMERHVSRSAALGRAARADVLSLTAWQAGMYAWMAVVIFRWGDGQIPPRDGFYFWSMMQVAMGCGFLAALPMNFWLIRRGVKRAM